MFLNRLEGWFGVEKIVYQLANFLLYFTRLKKYVRNGVLGDFSAKGIESLPQTLIFEYLYFINQML